MEGQRGREAEAQPSKPLPAGRCSTNQAKVTREAQEAQVGTVMCSKRGAHASDRDPNIAEAEEGAIGGSGIGPSFWPPANADPVGSELLMLMGPQGTWA